MFYLNISADGKVTIQYTLSNTLTASYINGDYRMNASCNGSWDGTQAEVNGQLLGEPQVNLRFLGCWFEINYMELLILSVCRQMLEQN